MRRVIFGAWMLGLLSTPVLASEGGIADVSYLDSYIKDKTWLVASADEPQMMKAGVVEEAEPAYKDRWFSLNKMHKYFGLTSIALGAATILAPKPEEGSDDGIHPALAEGATAFAALASASGLVFHIKDLNYGTGFYKDPDNWHALLGALGTAGFALATQGEGNEGHATYGVAGFGSMLLAIKIVW